MATEEKAVVTSAQPDANNAPLDAKNVFQNILALMETHLPHRKRNEERGVDLGFIPSIAQLPEELNDILSSLEMDVDQLEPGAEGKKKIPSNASTEDKKTLEKYNKAVELQQQLIQDQKIARLVKSVLPGLPRSDASGYEDWSEHDAKSLLQRFAAHFGRGTTPLWVRRKDDFLDSVAHVFKPASDASRVEREMYAKIFACFQATHQALNASMGTLHASAETYEGKRLDEGALQQLVDAELLQQKSDAFLKLLTKDVQKLLKDLPPTSRKGRAAHVAAVVILLMMAQIIIFFYHAYNGQHNLFSPNIFRAIHDIVKEVFETHFLEFFKGHFTHEAVVTGIGNIVPTLTTLFGGFLGIRMAHQDAKQFEALRDIGFFSGTRGEAKAAGQQLAQDNANNGMPADGGPAAPPTTTADDEKTPVAPKQTPGINLAGLGTALNLDTTKFEQPVSPGPRGT